MIAAFTVLLAVVLVLICLTDIRSYRIPDTLSLSLVAIGFFAPLSPSLWDQVIGAVAGFALFYGIGEWHFRNKGRDGLGIGDAKLFAAAGSWLGWQSLPPVLLIASLTGLLFVFVRKAPRNDPVAFAPMLSFGLFNVWMIKVLTIDGQIFG